MTGKIRVYCGLILFTYVTFHLVNHSLGLISFAALSAGLKFHMAVWRSWPGTVLLYGALTIHIAPVLWRLYTRRNFKYKRWEGWQVVLGFSIPILLGGHVFFQRVGSSMLGIAPSYELQQLSTWVFSPVFALIMPLGLIVVWTHGCVGIHFWLRLKRWWEDVRGAAFVVALLLPTLALAGYVASGVEATRQALDPAWIQQVLTQANFDPSKAGEGPNPMYFAPAVLAILLAIVFAGRWVRAAIAARRPKHRVHYRDFRNNRILDARPGETVLETLRAAGIPHASVCGGRGRCSTCRVKVGKGARRLHPRTAQEEKVVQRIEAPPNVRLACQIRPEFDVEITPLLPASAGGEAGYTKAANVQGREINVAIMFIDLRDSTKLCEDRLPYDVLFILNQFFAEMAETLTETGGHYAQFNGDGLMALYGLKGDIKSACYQAIEGATAMFQRLEILNMQLALELKEPLRMGIGIHSGLAIVGSMGPPATPIISAIGDNVNVAARLEGKTKELDAALVISVETAALPEIDLDAFERHDVAVRGRQGSLEVYAVKDPEALRHTLER